MEAAICSVMVELLPTGISRMGLGAAGLGVVWGGPAVLGRVPSPGSFGLPKRRMGSVVGLTGKAGPSPSSSARLGTLRFLSSAWSSGKGVVGRVVTGRGMGWGLQQESVLFGFRDGLVFHGGAGEAGEAAF